MKNDLYLYTIEVPVEKIDDPSNTKCFDWIARDIPAHVDENGVKHHFEWETYGSADWDILSAYLRRMFSECEYKEEVRFRNGKPVGTVLLPPLTDDELDKLTGYLKYHLVLHEFREERAFGHGRH